MDVFMATHWNVVKRLFDQVMALPIEERGGFVEAACAERPGLSRDLRRLLAVDPQKVELLDRPVVRSARRDGCRRRRQRPLGPGERFGRYVIMRPLGEGGTAPVYQGYDPDLDRMVALKVISADHASDSDDATTCGQGLREAQAMGRLSHPNVVIVYEIGREADCFLIVMEYVDGITLRQWRRDNASQWYQTVAAFSEAGKGLAAVHNAGLVHCDFKPENVLIDSAGRVKVTDFGLARGPSNMNAVFDRSPVECATIDELSRSANPYPCCRDVVGGTPGYMAPEQIAGEEITPRTDQFSFCVSMFEGLYGKRPFVAQGLDDLYKRMNRGAIEPPTGDSQAPSWLWPILERGLQGDPAHRYPSMRALLNDIDGACAPGLLRGSLATAFFGGRPSVGRLCGFVLDAFCERGLRAGLRGRDRRPYRQSSPLPLPKAARLREMR
jgi:serine/threonine protein kinase